MGGIHSATGVGRPPAMTNMSEDQKQGFDEWAIVELFGHQKIAGRVTEQSLGGASFVRIDVPGFEPPADAKPDVYGRLPQARAGFTKLVGAAAIYSITPTTEEIVRRALQQMHVEPISVYIPPERTLGAGRNYPADDEG